MDLKNRISAALEKELSAIYEELGITSGDIAPSDFTEWEKLTSSAALLFEMLIEFNRE
jgi:hypothetical protein